MEKIFEELRVILYYVLPRVPKRYSKILITSQADTFFALL